MKKFYVIFRQSVAAIMANKGRSFLTILGIIIGIGAVIALISLGTGLQAEIGGRISTLGASNLTVTPGASFGPGGVSGGGQPGVPGGGMNHGPPAGGAAAGGMAASTLTANDVKSLSDNSVHPLVKVVSGNITGSTVLSAAGEEQRYGVMGASPEYFSIQRLTPGQGSLFEGTDMEQAARVAVLGSQVAADVFGAQEPLGKTVQIQNEAFQVIAVLSPAEETGFLNPNRQIFIPNTSAMAVFQATNFSSITVQSVDDGSVDELKADVESTLLANHGISNPKVADFSVNSAKDLLSTMETITGILTSVLAGLAAISLLVGGIGIMNIMLVSVTERTREIGLRKAVGARTGDILNQFIIEAVLLTVTGGLIGIGFGVLIGRLAAHMIGFAPIITGWAVLLAVGVSGVIGLVFGVFPAAKAARLNPIEALRYE